MSNIVPVQMWYVCRVWLVPFKNQHALRKKGMSRGLHQSDVICLTVGWLKEASQMLEYGKNYDGYLTGEMFINQVNLHPIIFYSFNHKQLQKKIIPAFEAAHSARHQAVIMVDNSQGHLAYKEDALVILCMNVNPGGKQARMHDTWFM